MNQTKKDPNNDVKLSDEPMSLADSLVDDGKPQKTSFFKTKTFYIIAGVVSAVIFIAVLMLVLLSGGDEQQPQQRSLEQQQQMSEEQRLAQEEQRRRVTEATPSIDPQIAALPSDDFVFSPIPVRHIGEQSVKSVFEDMPEYRSDGMRIIAPDNRFLAVNDPYVLGSLEEVSNMVSAYIEEQRLIEERIDASGEPAWFIRSGEGFSDENYYPIQTADKATELRNNMRAYAVAQMKEKMYSAPWQTPEPEVVAQQPQVNPALTEEERERLLTMIETQRTNNLELVRENKQVREDMIDLKQKIASLVQRLEDSPNVNARLRATMIPESTGWKVTAVVGDRVYLINSAKETVTLSQGDKIPSSDLVVSHTDENTGIVLVTPTR